MHSTQEPWMGSCVGNALGLEWNLVWWLSSGFAAVSGAQLWPNTAVIALAGCARVVARGRLSIPANMASCISVVTIDRVDKLLSSTLKQTHSFHLCVSPYMVLVCFK